jgi:hypothetical protein
MFKQALLTGGSVGSIGRDLAGAMNGSTSTVDAWADIASDVLASGQNHQPKSATVPKKQAKRLAKQRKALARLRRHQTTCDTRGKGKYMMIRTFVPSEPPAGKQMQDRQIKTLITKVDSENGLKAHGNGVEECFIVEHTVALPHLGHIQ